MKCADTLRHRRPTEEVLASFQSLFHSGHSPSSALHTHKYDLQVKHGERFFEILADGDYCPSLQWCYYKYYTIFNEAYGPPDGEAMFESLQKAVEEYNKACKDTCAAVQKFESRDVIVALCSLLTPNEESPQISAIQW